MLNVLVTRTVRFCQPASWHFAWREEWTFFPSEMFMPLPNAKPGTSSNLSFVFRVSRVSCLVLSKMIQVHYVGYSTRFAFGFPWIIASLEASQNCLYDSMPKLTSPVGHDEEWESKYGNTLSGLLITVTMTKSRQWHVNNQSKCK